MRKRFAMFVVPALVLGALALAGQTQEKTSERRFSPHSAMHGCAQHERHAAKSADNLASAVNEARKSDNPTKMHAALELAYKTLAEIRSENAADAKALDRLQDHMSKIEAQEAKVKQEQARLEALIRGDGLTVPFPVN